LSICAYCGDPIRPGEDFERWAAEQRVHKECAIRAIIGSAAHQLHECSCYGGTREDPPGMTTRQAAVLAFETFVALQGVEKD
jgi:hypothetical protein